jgi:predicted kinase
MDRALLVIVTGAPASGKTTIARGLAAELEILALYKDEIKERLAEEIPGERLDWSRALGRAAYTLLYDLAEKLLSAGYACLIEANFHPELSLPGLSRLASSARVVQVVCQADPTVLERRYRQRFEEGGRSAVHLDLAAGRGTELAAAFRRDHALPLPGDLIRVDTTSIEMLDIAALAAEIRTVAAYAPRLSK